MKCVYHRSDWDGKCSAALVKLAHPDCELIGLDYGDDPAPFLSGVSSADEVWMVDFCLQPYSMMTRLWANCGKLVWIDHHKTAIDWATADEVKFRPPGKREVGKAACELVWEYLHPGEPIPEAVWLLGRYDTWTFGVDPVEEVFHPIQGYDGLYSISTYGRVVSHARPYKNQSGETGACQPEVIVSPCENSAGYLQVNLSLGGKRTAAPIHILVAQEFLLKFDGATEVNHLDGNRHNNRLDNLEWSTRNANSHHLKPKKLDKSLPYGVDRVRNQYRVRISVQGHRHFLGYFESAEEAGLAYDSFILKNDYDRPPICAPLNYAVARRPRRRTIFHDPGVLPFQYGMRLRDPAVDDVAFWDKVLQSSEYVEDIIRDGTIIQQYQEQGHRATAEYACFEVAWEGLQWIAVNGPYRGSAVFKSVFDPAKHDGMLSYFWNGKEWRFGLYSDRSDVDVSPIAKKYGGGGHRGAAGFQLDAEGFDNVCRVLVG